MTVETPAAPPVPVTRKWSAEVALVATSLIWGATFVVVKNALDDVSTVLFLALRFTAAAALLAVMYVARGGRFRTSGPILPGVLTGLFLYAGYLLQTLGLRYTTPATSGFITGLYIVLVPLLAAVLYRRRPGLLEWIGVALATAGMTLMTLHSGSFAVGEGELLTLACAFAFAAHILLLGHYSQRMSTDWLALLQIASCAVIALATFWWVEAPFLRLTTAVLIAVAVTSVLATALAFWLQTWAQRRTTPTRAAVIFALEPVFAWMTSWLVTGEVLTGRAIGGAACILGGILLVELKPLQPRQHQLT
jgi:drug/metabolite transporter (DMT)-like permease